MLVCGYTSSSSITPSSVIPQHSILNTLKHVLVRLATRCLRPSSPILLPPTNFKLSISVLRSALLNILAPYSVISRK